MMLKSTATFVTHGKSGIYFMLPVALSLLINFNQFVRSCNKDVIINI